jgi:hypothetical protein
MALRAQPVPGHLKRRSLRPEADLSHTSADGDGRVNEGRPDEAARGGAIVVEGVGRSVERVIPRARLNLVPPGVAIRDSKPLDPTLDLNGHVRRDHRTGVSTGIGVVRPGVHPSARGLRPG